MESYRNFEICDQCTQFRELTDNNFHKEAEEAEEFSECGCCLDLDELNEYKESVIKIENWWLKYCIKEIKSDKNSSCSQDFQDSSCYKCTDYGRCYDCEPFNPVFDTWGLPRGYTKMSSEEIRRYRYG